MFLCYSHQIYGKDVKVHTLAHRYWPKERKIVVQAAPQHANENENESTVVPLLQRW